MIDPVETALEQRSEHIAIATQRVMSAIARSLDDDDCLSLHITGRVARLRLTQAGEAQLAAEVERLIRHEVELGASAAAVAEMDRNRRWALAAREVA